MSVKIEVSYEHDGELIAITERLKDLPLKASNKAYQTGRFKRVYLQGNVPEDEPKAIQKLYQNLTGILDELPSSKAAF